MENLQPLSTLQPISENLVMLPRIPETTGTSDFNILPNCRPKFK